MSLTVVGKVDLDHITAEDRRKFYKKQRPIYDLHSCSCHFGYYCDEDIPMRARIVGYEDVPD